MIAKILFALFALPLAVVFYFCAKASANDRSDRAFPKSAQDALKFGSVLAVGLLLMFAVGGAWAPWLAVAVVAAVVVPIFTPVGLMLIAVVASWVTGKPIRWN